MANEAPLGSTATLWRSPLTGIKKRSKLKTSTQHGRLKGSKHDHPLKSALPVITTMQKTIISKGLQPIISRQMYLLYQRLHRDGFICWALNNNVQNWLFAGYFYSINTEQNNAQLINNHITSVSVRGKICLCCRHVYCPCASGVGVVFAKTCRSWGSTSSLVLFYFIFFLISPWTHFQLVFVPWCQHSKSLQAPSHNTLHLFCTRSLSSTHDLIHWAIFYLLFIIVVFFFQVRSCCVMIVPSLKKASKIFLLPQSSNSRLTRKQEQRFASVCWHLFDIRTHLCWPKMSFSSSARWQQSWGVPHCLVHKMVSLSQSEQFCSTTAHLLLVFPSTLSPSPSVPCLCSPCLFPGWRGGTSWFRPIMWSTHLEPVSS